MHLSVNAYQAMTSSPRIVVPWQHRLLLVDFDIGLLKDRIWGLQAVESEF